MTHDLIVIGAGPAGMSAAVAAAELGLKTLLLDEQPRLGGQIYRNVANKSEKMDVILGRDYAYGRKLVATLEATSVEICLSSTVWDITRDLSVLALQNGTSLKFRAPQLIVASGALERPSPLPGWTLPGVLNAGAAQIAMKSGGSIPSGKIVLVGGGPPSTVGRLSAT
ncbi:FAD-dependent oxidoreductase [Agrobacterium fabrum]|uniref:FAD-dependent oxidoreductase n=1 Tax=Agrobacterium fabrum TaxID=1176649 RepID=UPI00191CFD36